MDSPTESKWKEWEILTGDSEGLQWLTILAPSLDEFERTIAPVYESLKTAANSINLYVGIQGGKRYSVTPNKCKFAEDFMALEGITVVSDKLFMNGSILQTMDKSLLQAAETLIDLGCDRTPAVLVVTNQPDAPNSQIWVNDPAAELFRADGRELTKVDTTKFWHPQDLIDFYTELQNVAPGDKMTYTYRAQGSPDDPSYWLELTNEFTILESMGQRYRLSKVLDAKTIAQPSW